MRYVRHVVLDEADTLMDDSFNELMTHFLSRFQVQILFSKLFKTICINIDFKISNYLNIIIIQYLLCLQFKGRNESSNLTQLLLVSATMPTSLSDILGDIIDVIL